MNERKEKKPKKNKKKLIKNSRLCSLVVKVVVVVVVVVVECHIFQSTRARRKNMGGFGYSCDGFTNKFL